MLNWNVKWSKKLTAALCIVFFVPFQNKALSLMEEKRPAGPGAAALTSVVKVKTFSDNTWGIPERYIIKIFMSSGGAVVVSQGLTMMSRWGKPYPRVIKYSSRGRRVKISAQ